MPEKSTGGGWREARYQGQGTVTYETHAPVALFFLRTGDVCR